MRSGIHVGQVFGINIYVDWSWIFIFLLVTWNLAAGVFPNLHPDWGLGLDLSLGVLAALLFFLSVLAHELAHSVVAKANGLPVRRITLFIFGGVSNIEREPASPGVEFLVSIVGPLTSLALGVLFLVLSGANLALSRVSLTNLSAAPQVLAQMGPFTTMFLWLGPVNILLGIFNLVPGFPLDGGRVLRSILWAITRNLRIATRWATLVGQVIAWLFIVAGISMVFGFTIPFLGTGLVSGIWLAFIGWFLSNAAAQSYQQVVVEDMLEGGPVSRLMQSTTHTVPPAIKISQLVDDYMLGTDERAFPVVDGERLVGLVCLEDVRKVPRAGWENTLVREVMTPVEQLETVAPLQDAAEALKKLSQRDVNQMPVVQDGRLVGMLRRRDIIRWLQLHSNYPAAGQPHP
ncbi:MAG TPA: site-2 protease family protein [Anaerolineales bacterium]